MVEQLAAAPYKGLALLVLTGTGAFTHKHNLCCGNPLPEHDMGAGVAQCAAAAVQTFILQCLQIHL